MVAFKSSRLSALLVAFALVLTFFGALQLSGSSELSVGDRVLVGGCG